MRLVVVESPFASLDPRTHAGHLKYLRAITRECSLRGDSVYASHRMLPGAIDDDIPAERELGISLGLGWRRVADQRVFYVDRGWSRGMKAARELYEREGYSFECRSLGYLLPIDVCRGSRWRRVVAWLRRRLRGAS